MKRLAFIASLFSMLLFGSPALAAGTAPANMTSSPAITGSQIVWCPVGLTADYKCTFTQIDTFINAQFSGDFTVASGGVATLATVNANVGSFGSATNCVSFTTNGKGLITAASATTCTPAIASVTGLGTGVGTALAAALNGSAGMIGALTPTNNNCVVGNGSAWTSAACPGGSGAVSSVSGGIGVTVSPTAGAVVVSSPDTTRNNTTTSDTITNSDKGTIVTENNASSVAVAITTTGFVSTDYFTVKNIGAGTATYTPSAGTIDGAGTLVCKQNQSADLYFDGTNYHTLASSCAATVITVASGTAALGISAIASGACGTATTVSASGVATTDVIKVGFNGDPTATTGYTPGGMLTIVPYPTAGFANFKQCNLTGGSITPGALTINWRVDR